MHNFANHKSTVITFLLATASKFNPQQTGRCNVPHLASRVDKSEAQSLQSVRPGGFLMFCSSCRHTVQVTCLHLCNADEQMDHPIDRFLSECLQACAEMLPQP